MKRTCSIENQTKNSKKKNLAGVRRLDDGRGLAVSGMIMPPNVFSSAASAFTITLS